MAINLFRKSEYASENEFENASLQISNEGNNFLFIFKIKGKYFAQSKDKIYGGYDSIEKIIFRKNGKIFSFKSSTFSKKLGLIKEENQDSLIINKRILGPFNKIYDYGLNDNITFFLWYKTLEDTYIIVNNNKFGSFRKVYNIAFSADGSSFAFCYMSGSKKYVRINDVISEAYDDLSDFVMDFPTDFTGYIFKKNEGFYVKINDGVHGPFESAAELHYYKEYGHYTYNFSKDKINYCQINDSVLSGYDKYVVEKINKNFILISSVLKTEAAFQMSKKETSYHIFVKEIGLFSNITDHYLSATGDNYIFSYARDGQYYVVTGEYEYGPYKSVSNLMISSGGENYCFSYQKQYDNYYLNINGDIFGPYITVSDIVITNSASIFGFIFMKNGKYLINISGDLHGMYDAASNLKLSENGSGYVYKFSKRQKTGPLLFSKLQNFISFNGEIIEDDADIIDYQTNSIGIEAIIFKRNNSWFVNLNDTLFGPFESVSEWRFLPDESLFAFKFREKQSDTDNLQINGRRYLSRNKNLQIYIPIFSNDKKKYGFIHYSDTHYYVQICDETFGPYEFADFPSFSPDSSIFIFRYENRDGVYLNINGMKLGPFKKAEYTFYDGKLIITYLQGHMLYTDEITWQF
ncbi:MAG: hypothetical protein PHF33_02230 [Candidatus Delongbacteria bacterium]|nr:hypothetical protein [Candidatus Delongbacteria bacterium]